MPGRDGRHRCSAPSSRGQSSECTGSGRCSGDSWSAERFLRRNHASLAGRRVLVGLREQRVGKSYRWLPGLVAGTGNVCALYWNATPSEPDCSLPDQPHTRDPWRGIPPTSMTHHWSCSWKIPLWRWNSPMWSSNHPPWWSSNSQLWSLNTLCGLGLFESGHVDTGTPLASVLLRQPSPATEASEFCCHDVLSANDMLPALHNNIWAMTSRPCSFQFGNQSKAWFGLTNPGILSSWFWGVSWVADVAHAFVTFHQGSWKKRTDSIY